MSAGLLFALLPLIIVEIALLVYAILDVVKPERIVKGGNKTIWVLIIVFVNFIGPIIYLTVGREGAPWDTPSGPRQ